MHLQHATLSLQRADLPAYGGRNESKLYRTYSSPRAKLLERKSREDLFSYMPLPSRSSRMSMHIPPRSPLGCRSPAHPHEAADANGDRRVCKLLQSPHHSDCQITKSEKLAGLTLSGSLEGGMCGDILELSYLFFLFSPSTTKALNPLPSSSNTDSAKQACFPRSIFSKSDSHQATPHQSVLLVP